MVHLFLLGGSSCSVVLVGIVELVRLLIGRHGIGKARPEDVPAVMEALAKWRSPWHWKRK